MAPGVVIPSHKLLKTVQMYMMRYEHAFVSLHLLD